MKLQCSKTGCETTDSLSSPIRPRLLPRPRSFAPTRMHHPDTSPAHPDAMTPPSIPGLPVRRSTACAQPGLHAEHPDSNRVTASARAYSPDHRDDTPAPPSTSGELPRPETSPAGAVRGHAPPLRRRPALLLGRHARARPGHAVVPRRHAPPAVRLRAAQLLQQTGLEDQQRPTPPVDIPPAPVKVSPPPHPHPSFGSSRLPALLPGIAFAVTCTALLVVPSVLSGMITSDPFEDAGRPHGEETRPPKAGAGLQAPADSSPVRARPAAR